MNRLYAMHQYRIYKINATKRSDTRQFYIESFSLVVGMVGLIWALGVLGSVLGGRSV